MEPLSVLVADDDPVIRRLLEERLTRAKYRVITAEDGYQAVHCLERERFDVVVTDLVMPGDVGGLEVLEQTKQLSPDTEVLMITAHSSVDTAVAAMKKGATDYLEKPINYEELLLRMEKIANLKNILRNAEDIRLAMNVTETEASTTIQNLEMEVNKLQQQLDTIESVLAETDDSEYSRIERALNIIHDTD